MEGIVRKKNKCDQHALAPNDHHRRVAVHRSPSIPASYPLVNTGQSHAVAPRHIAKSGMICIFFSLLFLLYMQIYSGDMDAYPEQTTGRKERGGRMALSP